MKLHFIKSPLALILVLSIIATGCLKDKAFDNGEIQSVHSTVTNPKIVEIKLTAANVKNVLSLSFAASPNDTVVSIIPVNLATPDVAPQDIHVTLVPNDVIVSDYNLAHTDTTGPNATGVVTHYLVPTLYSVVNPGGVVIIPKGSHTGYLQIKFKPADFLGSTYAVGFSIGKVDEAGYTISGNSQNGMVVINIKNEYDGNYHVSGVRIHPTLGPFPFDYDEDMNTTSANSIDGAALADLGEGLNIVVNPDNTVTLSGDSRDVFPQAGKENKYDPVTKTFTLNYYYNTAAPRLINETLVKN